MSPISFTEIILSLSFVTSCPCPINSSFVGIGPPIKIPFNFWLSNIMDPAWYFGHRHYSQRKLTNLFKETRFKFEKIEFGGRIYELVSMILFYIFKWFFRSEIPFKGWFERKREKEYLSLPKGFVTIFLKFKKIKNE